jgi:hypothetical protein
MTTTRFDGGNVVPFSGVAKHPEKVRSTRDLVQVFISELLATRRSGPTLAEWLKRKALANELALRFGLDPAPWEDWERKAQTNIDLWRAISAAEIGGTRETN